MTQWDHARRSTTLDGGWKIRAADEQSRRTVADVGLDDSGWADTTVPGHWRDVEGLDGTDAVLYRHHFHTDPAPQHRRWLSIDGLCYQGDIWLDGAYLGDTEGYFAQHVFDVTDVLAPRREHVLAIEATCITPSDRSLKRNLTGVLQHAEHLDHDLNPGGLWRPVRLEETGDVRIDELQLLVLEADDDRAILRFRATLDSVATHTAAVATTVDPAESGSSGAAARHDQELVLAKGRNQVEWHVAVEQPSLWWPRTLGDPQLYDVRVEVSIDGDISHVRKRRTGMRTIELRNWIATINGERLHLKGANLGPASIDLAATTPDDHRRDLTMAADAGLDLLRVHGHVAAPSLYREADRIGMLLWQDFPLRWGHDRSVRRQAVRQASQMVQQLGHHPSIVLWSGHHEPDRQPTHADSEAGRRFPTVASRAQQLPSWNRSLLDRSVKSALRAADPTRPAMAYSGVVPHAPKLDGTDAHLWFGWRHGTVTDLRAFARRLPRHVRFVSEFGAQAVPRRAGIGDIAAAARFPHLDASALEEQLGAEMELLTHHSSLRSSASWDDWVGATQRHQAAVIRHNIEILRTLKYRPNGGYCLFLLNDAMPYVSAAVLDDERRPKLAWRALIAANAPVLPVAGLHDPHLESGTTSCPIHLVSDLRRSISNAVITTTWRAPGVAPRQWRHGGSFAADSVVRIGSVKLVAPEPGPARLHIEVEAPGVTAHNTYDITIV